MDLEADGAALDRMLREARALAIPRKVLRASQASARKPALPWLQGANEMGQLPSQLEMAGWVRKEAVVQFLPEKAEGQCHAEGRGGEDDTQVSSSLGSHQYSGSEGQELSDIHYIYSAWD